MKKVLLCLICMIFSFFIFTGCEKKEEIEISEPKAPTGEIIYFSYYTGGGWAGITYIISQEEDKYMMEVTYYGYDSPDLKFEVTKDNLKEIAKIINEYEIYKWDGFNESDPNVYDGDGFSLNVTYDTNDKISAYGYMRYPKNYSKGASILKKYLNRIAEELAFNEI